jgi:peroxiredoxin
MKRYIFPALLLALCALFPVLLSAVEKPFSPFDIEKLTGEPASDFTLNDINGRPLVLSSLKGKVVLLNFWSLTCPPCRDEMPSMNKLYAELKARGLEVVAVSVDPSLSMVREFVTSHGLAFSVLIDAKRSVSRQYRVFSLPTTFLISKKGEIVEKFFGEEDWTSPEMKRRIEKLL